MKKIIALFLLLASLFLGYVGIDRIRSGTHSVDVFGAELSVEEKDLKTQGYILLGSGVVLLIIGGYLLKNKKR